MVKDRVGVSTLVVLAGLVCAFQGAPDATKKEEPAKVAHVKWPAPVVVKEGSLSSDLDSIANTTDLKGLFFNSLEMSGEGIAKQWPEKDGWKLVAREIGVPGAKEATVTFIDGRNDKTKIGDVKVALTKSTANVVFALRVVRDAKEQKTSVTAAAFRVSSDGFEELAKFDVPPSALRDAGDTLPPYWESGAVGGMTGDVADIVAAWSWNGADADVCEETARARDHGRNTDLQGAGPELAKFATQPLSKWPRPVLLVVFAPPAKDAPRFPELQETHLVDTTEFVTEKARTEIKKDGAPKTIPEQRVWIWTTADDVDKVAAKIGCVYRSLGSLVMSSPPARAKLVRRTNRSHEQIPRYGRGTFEFPDAFMSVSSCSADERAYAVSFDLCPDKKTRSSPDSEKDLPDPCLRYVKRVVLTHTKHLQQAFEALVSNEKARERFKFVLDDLTGEAPPTAWIRMHERTVSVVADEPLWGPPMLYAQLDATMWLDITCCGEGPVVLSIAGGEASMYADLCAAAKESAGK
jgi:hypothetical protein